MYGIVDIVYEFERNKCIVGVLMAFGRLGLKLEVVSMVVLLWLIVWPGWIPGLLLMRMDQDDFWERHIYRGNAAENLVDECYFENLFSMLKLTFGKCDQNVDSGELGTWIWRSVRSGKRYVRLYFPSLACLRCSRLEHGPRGQFLS